MDKNAVLPPRGYTNLPRDSKLVLATLSVPLAIRTIPLGRWDVTEVLLLSKFCQDFGGFVCGHGDSRSRN